MATYHLTIHSLLSRIAEDDRNETTMLNQAGSHENEHYSRLAVDAPTSQKPQYEYETDFTFHMRSTASHTTSATLR